MITATTTVTLMDNITHSLVGVSVAEAAFHWRYRKNKARKFTHAGRAFRLALLFASFAANNFPDLDIFYTRITAGRVGTLLHHRGHTHTLGMVIPQTLLICLFTWLFVKKNRDDFLLATRDWIGIAAISALGICLHILLDSWNSYGVHPFWPFSSEWVHADSVFILEPWIWVTLIPPLYFSSNKQTWRGKAAKTFLSVLFCGLLALSWVSRLVPLPIALALTVWGAIGFKFMKKLTPPVRIADALFTVGGIVLIFLGVHQVVKKDLSRDLSLQAPTSIQHDLILSPMPANPLCWGVFSVEHEGDEYVVRRGIHAPYLVAAKDCNPSLAGTPTAPVQPTKLESSEKTIWIDEFRAPLSEFKALAGHCWFAAFLQFARAPFWVVDGKDTVVGDMRYDREKGLGFSEFVLPSAEAKCPEYLPRWGIQRADLLQ